MKTIRQFLLAGSGALILMTATAQNPPVPPADAEDFDEEILEVVLPDVFEPTEGDTDGGVGVERPGQTPADAGRRPEARPAPSAVPDRRDAGRPARPSSLPTPPAAPMADGENGLRLNFRGVPLELVLDYLSDAAGFIINLETQVEGRVDVWSNQPLDREEAVTLLNSVLNRNGYAAIRQGRTLTIVRKDEAKTRDIPVRVVDWANDRDLEGLPRNDEIVTQIIPVRFINAVQLVKDLQPLLPTTATLTANEGGNALLITDTQTNIRRMASIVRALDTAISSVSTVRVFPLYFSDAKIVATVIRDLFQPQETQRNAGGGGPGGGAARFLNQIRGGGAQAGGETAATSGRAPVPRVVAVADERSNAVVVNAPEEQMLVIAGVIEEMDVNVDDITELRVFRLTHADPQETATLLNDLFSDTSRQQTGNQRGQVRFGGGPQGGNARGSTDASSRMQQQSKVVAVPDLRTGSVVVSAARDLMGQIAAMLNQLDADPARKQRVFVYDVENSDPQAVQEVLQTLFPDQNVGLNRNTRNTQRQGNNALNTRQTQTQNQGFGAGQRTGTGFGGNVGGANFGGQR
ncbi:MAG: hypothetical protein KF833_06185 [Verrucomicrobiae bacterium]|nr:hypothetical protein [Verrucomicrobiae bacterium]